MKHPQYYHLLLQSDIQMFLGSRVLIVLILVTLAHQQIVTVDPSKCSNSSYYHYNSFSCKQCPTNTSKSSPTFCRCLPNHYHDEQVIGFESGNACKTIDSSNPTDLDVKIVRKKNGDPANTSVKCQGNSYPNFDRTQCIVCPQKTPLNDTTYLCQVPKTQTDLEAVNAGCLNNSISPYPQYCHRLINLCAKEGYMQSGSFCKLITNEEKQKPDFPKFQFSANELSLNELGFTVSTQQFVNSTLIKNKLDFYVAEFDLQGNYVDFRPLRNQLFACNLSIGDSIDFQSFGASFYRDCKLNLNPSYGYFYDLYIKSAYQTFAEVPIQFIFQNITYHKRFTQSTQSIRLNLTSLPPLLTPIVTISILGNNYTTAVVETESSTSTNLPLIGPFIALNIVVLGYFIYAMYLYVKYNPQNLGQNTYCFRMMWGALWLALRCWTVGMFVWLAGVSTFCFCFYKLQNALYIILPDPNDSSANSLYYTPFKTVFFIMFALGLLSVFQLIWRITAAEYFLMDWEKSKQIPGKFSTQHNNKQVKPSIWRRLFVVNQLYQLAMKRFSSVEFTLLFSGLFLEGLQWSNLKYMIPNTNIENTAHTSNPVLAYFITTFLLVIISLCQIVIRKLVKIWWPLPAEEFIDLCCLSNLSIFIFDQGIHGYYIHGMSPLGKAEGSLEYIQSIFQKESESYGRNRGLLEQDEEQIQAYEVIAPRVMRFQFNKLYIERVQQVLSTGIMANTIISKPMPELKGEHYDNLERVREDMINNFRLYLEEVKLNKSQQIQSRNWFTRMFSCPPDATLHQKLPVMYKDPDYLFTNVFMSGNELYLLVNEINIFNFWYLVLGSTFQAILLTMLVKLLIGFYAEFKMKRNISINTFVDDKFFV